MNKICCGSMLHDVSCLGHAPVLFIDLFIDNDLLAGIPMG
jgi:hypothetical protein